MIAGVVIVDMAACCLSETLIHLPRSGPRPLVQGWLGRVPLPLTDGGLDDLAWWNGAVSARRRRRRPDRLGHPGRRLAGRAGRAPGRCRIGGVVSMARSRAMMAARVVVHHPHADRPDSAASRQLFQIFRHGSPARSAMAQPQPPGPPDTDRDPGQRRHDEQGVEQRGRRECGANADPG